MREKEATGGTEPTGNLFAKKVNEDNRQQKQQNHCPSARQELVDEQATCQHGQHDGLRDANHNKQIEFLLNALKSFFVWVLFHALLVALAPSWGAFNQFGSCLGNSF